MGRVEIIAEAGVNHNGSIERALELIALAAAAGADVVKFQTFSADRLVSRNAAKAEYQARLTGNDESQYEMLRRLELTDRDHRFLREACDRAGIEFMSSPFDEESVDLLVNEIGVRRLKLGSGEITNAPLLLKAASTGLPLIVSTGMSTLAEVEAALGVLAFGYVGNQRPAPALFSEAYRSDEGRKALREKVVLLHCTTEYPAPFAEVNLRAMITMKHAFALPVGFSDHTPGIAMPIAAAALGASVVEKHFTTDRNLPGPDHAASLAPDELRAMVTAIRAVEVAMGDGVKVPSESERKNIAVARKSLRTVVGVSAGEAFSAANLGVKRPGTGVNPFEYWNWLGRIADRDYAADEEL